MKTKHKKAKNSRAMKLIPGHKAQESQNEMSEKEKTVHKNSDAHNRKRYGAANATLLC